MSNNRYNNLNGVLKNYDKNQFVGSIAKGRISKQVFQENKARQIFERTNVSYPLIRTRLCAYQWVRNACF